jgi:ABC-type phosphate transport system substrate-binding protein
LNIKIRIWAILAIIIFIPSKSFTRGAEEIFKGTSGRISITCTPQTLALVSDISGQIASTTPGLKISLRKSGPTRILRNLSEGRADAVITGELPDKKNPGFTENPFATFGVAIIVNAENPAGKLKTEQLKKILEGKTVKWPGITGNAPKINVYSYKNSNRTTRLIEKNIMDGEKISAAFTEVEHEKDMKLIVSADLNALGFISITSGLTNKIRVLRVNGRSANIRNVEKGRYPLSGKIYLFSRGKTSEKIKKFTEFLNSGTGRKIIRNHKLIPLQIK